MIQLNADIVGEHSDGGIVFVRLKQPEYDLTVLVPKAWIITMGGTENDQGDQPGSDV